MSKYLDYLQTLVDHVDEGPAPPREKLYIEEVMDRMEKDPEDMPLSWRLGSIDDRGKEIQAALAKHKDTLDRMEQNALILRNDMEMWNLSLVKVLKVIMYNILLLELFWVVSRMWG